MYDGHYGGRYGECHFHYNGVHFNLELMKSSTSPVTLTDTRGVTYDVNFCNSYRLLNDPCTVDDAVAVRRGSCDYYGRFRYLEKITVRNETNPWTSGLVLTYADGMTCQGHPGVNNRATFVISCRPEQREPVIFKGMTVRDEFCERQFFLSSSAGCAVSNNLFTSYKFIHW